MEDGSEETAATNFTGLGFICKRQRSNPTQLRTMDFKGAGNFLVGAVSDLREANAAGSYVESITKAMKSWWLFDDIVVRKKIKFIRNSNKYDDERVSTPRELQKILDHSDLKTRAAVAFVVFEERRIRPLGDHIGAEGLRVSDFFGISVSGGRPG